MKLRSPSVITVAVCHLFFDDALRVPGLSEVDEELVEDVLDLLMQSQILELGIVELLVGDSGDGFEELHEVQPIVQAIAFFRVLVDYCHFGHAEAVDDVALRHVELGLLHEQLDEVFHGHEVLVGRAVRVVDGPQRIEVHEQDVVDVDGPDQGFPEDLPVVRLAEGDDVLLHQLLEGLRVRLAFTKPDKFLMSNPNEQLDEFKSHKREVLGETESTYA